MRIKEHEIFKDIKIIELFECDDLRGKFIKLYNADMYVHEKMPLEIKEIYYSISNKNTIRGMHFQLPPSEHEKLIHVLNGKVIDVIVDLRKDSKTYKQNIALELSGKEKVAVYIPKGFAHGFKALEDNTVMQYCVSSVYDCNLDSGIYFDSIGYNWGIVDPIVSEKDKNFRTLDEFDSPF